MKLARPLQLLKRRWFLMILSVVTFLTIATLGTITLVVAATNNPVGNYTKGSFLPTGQYVTPIAAPGSTFERLTTGLRSDGTADANGAVSTALSPDGKTLLVLTSGYNVGYKNETTGEDITYPVLEPATGTPSTVTTTKFEWVFIYDVSSGKLVRKQQISLPNTFTGLTWAPDGQRFYVSAGIDDRVYVYQLSGNGFVPSAPFILLGHNSNSTAPLPSYDGGLLKDTAAKAFSTGAVVAGLDVSKDGKTLVAANFENDSISVIDTTTRLVRKEIKFFQAGGSIAMGEYPYSVAIVSNNQGAAVRAYVTSQRDDEVLSVDLNTNTVTRIAVGGGVAE
jgi:YVTN family beta-propeller protein